MKKSLIFASILAFTIAPVAIAQNAPPPPEAPPAPETPPTPPADEPMAPPATEQPPMPETPPPAAAEPVMQSAPAPTPTSATDEDYPVCSKTVTDNCRNASEGGKSAMSKAKPHKKRK